MTINQGPGRTVQSFRNALLFGGANLDIKCCSLDQIAQRTSNPARIRTTLGGVARNVAHNLAMLGIRSQLVSVVGNDLVGEHLLRETTAVGVDTSLIIRTTRPTGLYVTVLDAAGDPIVSISDTEALTELTPILISKFASVMAETDLVVADTNLTTDSLEWLAETSAKISKPIVIDPVSVAKSPRLAGILQRHTPVFLLSPNRDELSALVGRSIASEADLSRAVMELHDAGVQNIIVGLGDHGAYASSNDARKFIESNCAHIIDVTGAGDAALAAALWALGTGRDIIDSAKIGQAAASLTIATWETVSPEIRTKRLLELAQHE